MATEKETILQYLKKLYPEGVIYKDDFTPKHLGIKLHLAVRRAAKEAEKTAPQWLQANGFSWRETGYVEADMHSGQTEWRNDSVVALSDSILRRYPLIGQYVWTPEEYENVFSAAMDCVRKMSREGAVLTAAEELVVTVATVGLLCNWSNELLDETRTNTFWNYIFLQYGFNPENSQAAGDRVYACFRHAIKNTLTHYKRFFAPDTTMRYYTSLLMHAIAPVTSIESLFEILFDFYIKNLDFQYVPEDTSYKTLVKGMQARWTADSASIQLKSSAVMSGLKTLFLERPCYMAVLCDELVRKIDLLLRGIHFETEDRWDRLLLDWYEKKSNTERSQLQGQKREHHAEFVATSTERIFMQYVMESGKVGLSLPRIRLSETGDSRPALRIFQNGREIFLTTLSVTGNDLGLTTRRRFISLEDTALDFAAPLHIRCEIEYLNDIIYDSGTKLSRDTICFDSSGNERNVKNGIALLFADERKTFDFSNESGVSLEEHPGQLYRVNLSEVGSVTVNGAEIFADEKQAGHCRLYASVRSVKGIRMLSEGKSYRLFDRPFLLNLLLPKGENALRYQMVIDGQQITAQETAENNAHIYSVPVTSGCLHIVRVVDMAQSLVVLEYPYLILPRFSYSLDKARYLENEDEINLTIRVGDEQQKRIAYRSPGSDTAISEAEQNGFTYEIDVPTVSCSFGDQCAFSLADHIWYKDIDKSLCSRLQLPSNWQGKLLLNEHSITVNAEGIYELGNLFRSGRRFHDSEFLWLQLCPPDGEPEHIPLTQIHFAPSFTEAPVVFRVNELQWLPRGRFVGDSDARFRLKLSGAQELNYEVGSYDKLLCRSSDIRHGRYHCEVYIQSRDVFSGGRETLVETCEIIVGDENEFRFEDKELALKGAIYWDINSNELKRMEMIPGAGILENLRFVGVSTPSWESIALPKYEARLVFEAKSGRRIPFSFNPDSGEYVYTNPVKLWVVNDRQLILTTAEEEVVYFDTSTASVVNRNPDLSMSRKAQQLRLQNPDYFEYERRDALYV